MCCRGVNLAATSEIREKSVMCIRTVALLLSSFFALHYQLSGAADNFPRKPVRIVTGNSPGATPDVLARLIGAKLAERWKQPVVIENRAGALGTLASIAVAKATPDGYTLLASSPAFAVRAALAPSLPYDPIKDFSGVAELGYSNTVLVVSPGIGVTSVKALAAFALSNPGKTFFASASATSSDRLNTERFRAAIGINAQHVAFKGQAESIIEIAAGRAHFTTTGLTTALSFIKDGKLIPLLQRVHYLPGVPLINEVVPQWTQIGSQSILAPANTPLTIRRRISQEIAWALSLPDIKEKLNVFAFQVTPTTPEETERNLPRDIAAFAKVIKEIGLKPVN